MKKQHLIADGVWLVLGLAVSAESWRLNVGTFSVPGPGFLPFWAGALLAILSLISLLRTTTEPPDEEPSVWAGVNIPKLGLVILALLLYVVLFNTLGFLLCTFLLLLFLFRVVEPYRWYVVLLASALSLASVYVLFVRLLDVRLPGGVLDFWP
ncbi:MAG: tripartite tricarboxylate transporter TctB family protein [Candidatus Marsarchaeota archaeon]|nr:tripartite tricarboxylate transporter TctB family protein [Candidatus Marsarchaeota archaeon]